MTLLSAGKKGGIPSLTRNRKSVSDGKVGMPLKEYRLEEDGKMNYPRFIISCVCLSFL